MKLAIAAMMLIAASASIAQVTGKATKEQKSPPAVIKVAKVQFLQVEALDDSILGHKNLWSGYDFEAIATATKESRSPKGEFESQDDYASRQARQLQQPIYGSVGLSSRIAVVVPNIQKQNDMRALTKDGSAVVGYVYDPEAKILKICKSGQNIGSAQLGQAVESVVVSTTKKTTYPAQNSYGAKVEVSSITGEHINIAVPTGYEEHCGIQIEADSATAQELLKSSGVVLHGRVKSPYMETSSIYSKATITSPIEIIISVTRLLFVPDQVTLLNRDSRRVMQTAKW